MMQTRLIQRASAFDAGEVTPAVNLAPWDAARGHGMCLEPLLDPDVPHGPMARIMLALGLAAKEPAEHGLATDALIASIDDGRFDAIRFGESLGFLLPLLKAPRLARTLAQAARVSSL